MKPKKACKGCGSLTRPTPFPGPRCHTCNREVRKARRARNHGAHVVRTYGITADEYQAIKAYQGGTCAICRTAKGLSKALAVDHRHADGLVRGTLCTRCNRMLGDARDDPDFFVRAVAYLLDPPAPKALGRCVYVPSEES